MISRNDGALLAILEVMLEKLLHPELTEDEMVDRLQARLERTRMNTGPHIYDGRSRSYRRDRWY